jgi:DNA-binding XRE family transcriptional regulator
MDHTLLHEDFKQKLLNDDELKNIYNKLDEEFSILEEFIKARKLTGKTQAEVASIMGTQTSAIGRLESSIITKKHSPTLATLQKYANAIGYRVKLHLVKN